MGVASRVVLSNDGFIERHRTNAETVAHFQRIISRCRRGSNNQRKLRAQLDHLRHGKKIRSHNECHRITTEIIRNHDLIAIEDLDIANMTRSARGTDEKPGRNVSDKSGLNHSIVEQSWASSPLNRRTRRSGWNERL